MSLRVLAFALLGLALAPTHDAQAQSAMCVEPVPPVLDRVERDQDAPAPLRDEDLPWCASAEDPRCAPLHGSSSPGGMGLRQMLAIDAEPHEPALALAGRQSFTPRAGLAPSAGRQRRIERPPR